MADRSAAPGSAPAAVDERHAAVAGRPEPSLELVSQADSAWTAFLSRCELATPFHHPAWSSVVAETYGYRAFAAVLTEGSEVIAGVPLIAVRGLTGRRRWLALPFTDECPPLMLEPALAPVLVRKLGEARVREEIAEIEIRSELAAAGLWRHEAGVIHTLELRRDPEALMRTFSRSQVQRNIARAEREGVRVALGAEKADLVDSFYRLHLATRRRQGVPVQPRRFFDHLWSRMIEPGHGFVLVAYVDDAPAAAAVFLTWNDTVVYKFGASDARYLGRRPNHLLFWHAIRSSCELGYRRFDFGKTDLANSGLRAFKGGWGTREEPLVYSSIADGPSPARNSRGARVMSASIRHAPAMLCRALGATLYRYAA